MRASTVWSKLYTEGVHNRGIKGASSQYGYLDRRFTLQVDSVGKTVRLNVDGHTRYCGPIEHDSVDDKVEASNGSRVQIYH